MTICINNLEAFQKAERKILKPTDSEIRDYSATYAYCCASFHQLRRSLKIEDYYATFQSILLNQATAKYERTNIELIDNIDSSSISTIPYESFILCAFHYSAYQVLSSLLIKENRKYFIVINNSDANCPLTIKENRRAFQEIKKKYGNSVQNDIIHLYTNEREFIFEAKELLESGYIMLVFVDGNSGLDGIMRNDNRNLEKIDFLKKKIYVRKGIPSLSYAFKVPIIPIFSLRNKARNSCDIYIHDPIIPNFTASKQTYISEAICKLYGILEMYVKKALDEWEGWLYIYKWLDINSFHNEKTLSLKSSQHLEYNKHRYMKFQINENYFVLDKDSHLSYEITYNIYKSLDNISTISTLSKKDLEELINMKIII